MTAAPTPTVVCVLGMARSGTSLTTRVLNIAGVDLGPEEELLGVEPWQLAGEGERVLARARRSNPEGHWEHYRLMRLNERILRRLGGSWRELPRLRAGWERSAELAGEREEARAILSESFSGSSLWGWKDPRNSLTLPFWRDLLPSMRCVVCVRNPADVAASLRRRDGIALEDGVGLWQAYVAAGLANTDDANRLVVRYESHLEAPLETAVRLAGFIGRDGALAGGDARREVELAVNPRLWRNRTSAEELAHAAWVPPGALALYRLTERLAAS